MLPSICCLCKLALRNCAALRQFFSLKMLNPILLKVLASTMAALKHCLSLTVQQFIHSIRGSLPEILEDSLSQSVYPIYFLLEIAVSFGR